MQGIFLNRSGKFTAIRSIFLKTVSLCLCGRRRRQRREAAFCERLGTKVRKDGEERTIPAVTEGQTFHPVTASISEHYTTPPKPYSEDTLLSAMETAGNQEFDEETEKKGLGTPATRASIIEKLVSSGYVVRKGKPSAPDRKRRAVRAGISGGHRRTD